MVHNLAKYFVITLVVLCGQVRLNAQERVSFEEKVGETLGATLVAYVIDQHVGIAVMAESYNEEVLDDEEALEIVRRNIVMLDQVGPLVVELTKYDECGEAKDYFQTLARTLKSLKAANSSFEKYVESGSDRDYRSFEKAIEKVDQEIAKLSQ